MSEVIISTHMTADHVKELRKLITDQAAEIAELKSADVWGGKQIMSLESRLTKMFAKALTQDATIAQLRKDLAYWTAEDAK